MSAKKIFAAITLALLVLLPGVVTAQVENPQSGSVGLQGRIPSPPPTVPATITVPANGQGFTELPITVSGICPENLLVKVFKNNVFAGSVQCENGSYSIIVDLFSGQNELVARVYDELDQPGPDSNLVNVVYNDDRQGAGSRPTLTSNYAKRGANPGQTLTWPIILSGGTGPYAVSVDWGDGSAPDLISREFAGEFDITHAYDSPGVYNIVVKVTDTNGLVAFLQLVGVANGPLSQDDNSTDETDPEAVGATETKIRILWEPAALIVPFIISTFWLGKKYELKMLRRRIERGDRPF